ncbi:MAG: exopolysaccharide Pel transporter PelG [Hydrogenothermaceae bacterium]|nr:exopolysaccharide Pel transporter PelG [Hydrogenothermaceae bacterium]
MAGISFELRKVLREKTISAIFKAFGYSFALSSGPYVITILSLVISYFLSYGVIKQKIVLTQFQVSITYLIAFSLIYTGFSQLFFTRYVADRFFERDYFRILPNFIGILILNMAPAFLISLLFSFIFLNRYTGIFYTLFFSLTFTILVGIWIVNIILTGLKSYKYILFSFFVSYLIFVIISYFMASFGLNGLMFSFFLGQSVLFLLLLFYFVYHNYSEKLIEFDFLKKDRIFISLIFTGFFYNLAIWTDKFVFWFNESTSTSVIGPMIRYSIVYDIPIFLAYLAISPGMAVFFLKLEAEFASYYERYYDAVRQGLTLQKIYQYGDEMIEAARTTILDTIRIQGIFNIVIIIFDRFLFEMFKIPLIYLPLFHIMLLGTYLQLILLSLFALFFYFDRRKESLILSITLFSFNLLFSVISIILGPYFYGYGFTLSIFFTVIISLVMLRRFLYEIHYHTFMLR